MDQQVSTKDLYELAHRYGRGDKLPPWVEEFLAERLPGGLLLDLNARRRKALTQSFSTDGGDTAEQPKPKRKRRLRRWTPDDPVTKELSRDYVDGRVMKEVADRLEVDHYSVLVSAYDKEFVAKMRSVRSAVRQETPGALAVKWGWKGDAQDHDSAKKFLLSSLESEGLILGPTPSVVLGDE